MEKPCTFQQQLDVLAYGEVHPLLFATDIERGHDIGVHVVLIDPTDGVESNGHLSTTPVFTRRFAPKSELPVTDDEVSEMRLRTISAFGERLREVLTPSEVLGR